MVKQFSKEGAERLGRYRITHGDLKHTNILITENGPVLTDLDGAKVHKCNWTYKIRRTTDVDCLKKLEVRSRKLPC